MKKEIFKYKIITFIFSCILFNSCKGKEQYDSIQKNINTPNNSLDKKPSNEIQNIKYISAVSGLNYRNKPRGK